MAGDWIKMRTNLDTDPAVFLIAATLGMDELAVVGRLWKLWSWADQHTKNGDNMRLTAALVDRLVSCPGFAAAMKSADWLDGSDGALVLPHFERHNGETAKVRSTSAERVARHRAELAAGGRSFPRGLKRKIKSRDNNTCQYCGRKEGEKGPRDVVTDCYMHIDHVIPESRGGRTVEENLVTCCAACNMTKGARTPDEAGLKWPVTETGFRYGSNEKVEPEKRREDNKAYTQQRAIKTPTVEEVIEAGKLIGIEEEICRKWFDECEANPFTFEGGWTRIRGGEAVPMNMDRWRNALSAYAVGWRSRRALAPKGASGGSSGTPSVWTLKQQIEAAQAEMERIRANPENKEQIPGSWDRRLKAEPAAKVKELKAKIDAWRGQMMAGKEAA